MLKHLLFSLLLTVVIVSSASAQAVASSATGDSSESFAYKLGHLIGSNAKYALLIASLFALVLLGLRFLNSKAR